MLATIMRPEIALSIWQRPSPMTLAAAMAETALEGVDDVDCIVDVPVAALALAASLAVHGYDETTAHLLAADIAALAGHFAPIAGSGRMKARLEVIDSNSCRLFHADYVTFRLLTTYVGQGTQWVRAGEAETIGQLNTGDVAIFKGRLLAEDRPVLHRSPPIAGTGETRLLLVLDPVPTS